ncbi:hypothetical protein OK016_21420 [Vibrio chagasii]|nr:hypothetical protein [Vibrio chagasii]
MNDEIGGYSVVGLAPSAEIIDRSAIASSSVTATQESNAQVHIA